MARAARPGPGGPQGSLTYLVGELNVGGRMAELAADVHLDTARGGRLCGLDGAHDPG